MSIVRSLLNEGILIDSSLLDFFKNEQLTEELVGIVKGMKLSFLSKENFSLNADKIKLILDNLKVHKTEPERQMIEKTIELLSLFSKPIKKEEGMLLREEIKSPPYKILASWAIPSKKVEVADFVKHFRNRFIELKKILQEHTELENLVNINKISVQKQNISIIGLVISKRITKNKNLMVYIEDMTGKVAVLINKSNTEAFKKAQQILLDEVIGIKCNGNSEILFVNDIIFPEAYSNKRSIEGKEEYAAFISDTHIGSSMFLKEEFLKFLSWINLERGNETQKELASKIKYLFILGDTVDGVGVYPGQEELLEIKDVRDQYVRLAEYLDSIRKDIHIFMIPGQHDAVRVAEPQPQIGENYAPDLYKITNLVLLSNPAMVEVANRKVLMYHGASYHNIIDNIEELRMANAHNTPTKVSKLLLSKRHLAPTHSDTTYIPAVDADPMLMRESPDIFATGDLHKTDIGIHNNIRIIAASCWQSMTPFEEKVGNHPDPCKVPILNLKTNAIKIMDFSS